MKTKGLIGLCVAVFILFIMLSGCTGDGTSSADNIINQRNLEKQTELCAKNAKEVQINTNEYVYKKISNMEKLLKSRFDNVENQINDLNIIGLREDMNAFKTDMNVLNDINARITDLNMWLVDEFD